MIPLRCTLESRKSKVTPPVAAVTSQEELPPHNQLKIGDASPHRTGITQHQPLAAASGADNLVMLNMQAKKRCSDVTTEVMLALEHA